MSLVNVEVKDAIATVTMNRPDALNALNKPLVTELSQALEKVSKFDSVRVVILTGAGKAFCAGGDLKEMDDAGDATAHLKGISQAINKSVILMRKMPKPVIARLNGAAIGAGLGLAMAADIRIARSDAKLGTGFMNAGLAPGCGTFFYPRLVGMTVATDLVFTSRIIKGNEAERIGLITKAVDGMELDAAVQKMAEDLRAKPAHALAEAKALLEQSLQGYLEAQVAREAEAISSSGSTEEFREGMRAFKEKRKPVFWKGAPTCENCGAEHTWHDEREQWECPECRPEM